MAFDSFRDFINALDKAGELKRIAQSGAIHTLGAHQRMAMSMDEVTNEPGAADEGHAQIFVAEAVQAEVGVLAEFHDPRRPAAEGIPFGLLPTGGADTAVSITSGHCFHDFSRICLFVQTARTMVPIRD